MSGLVNKIKDAVHSDKKHEQPTGTSGPHDSRTANAADPRVDSDRDHRANPATGTTGSTGTYGSSTTGGAGLGGDNFTQSGTGVTGAPGGHSNTLGSNTSSNRGPHDSNLANKADPRVDSDRDHRAAPGSTTGTSGLGSSNYGSTTGTTGTSGLGSSNRGPHDSNLANKADPRVDSDRDHRGAPGSTGVTGNNYGTTGTTGSSGLTGNPGPAPNTAGPHKSDMLNKVDPRVDSDRDGSKTVGQDQTYARS